MKAKINIGIIGHAGVGKISLTEVLKKQYEDNRTPLTNEQLNRLKEHEMWNSPQFDTKKVVPQLVSTIEDLKYELRKATMYAQGVPHEIMNRWIEKSEK